MVSATRKLRYIVVLFALQMAALSPLQVSASDVQTFIHTHAPIAKELSRQFDIPVSIIMGQAILESGYGKSKLAQKNHNYFGIKDFKSKTQGSKTLSKYQIFDSPESCFARHSQILGTQKRYRPLFKIDHYDYKSWAKGLKACGYAEDQLYAARLTRVIERYQLHLMDAYRPFDVQVLNEITIPIDNMDYCKTLQINSGLSQTVQLANTRQATFSMPVHPSWVIDMQRSRFLLVGIAA
jgi:hypothetical protein